jgi:hypothetical protein
LKKALEIAERGNVPQENLYMMVPIFHSEEMHTNNEALLRKISDIIEK